MTFRMKCIAFVSVAMCGRMHHNDSALNARTSVIRTGNFLLQFDSLVSAERIKPRLFTLPECLRAV